MARSRRVERKSAVGQKEISQGKAEMGNYFAGETSVHSSMRRGR
jgi:hypothetical protein